jgi:hypothetical protein
MHLLLTAPICCGENAKKPFALRSEASRRERSVSKGNQVASTVTEHAWTRCAAAEAFELVKTAFDKGLFLGACPALDFAFHLKSLHTGLEFLVPDQ